MTSADRYVQPGHARSACPLFLPLSIGTGDTNHAFTVSFIARLFRARQVGLRDKLRIRLQLPAVISPPK